MLKGKYRSVRLGRLKRILQESRSCDREVEENPRHPPDLKCGVNHDLWTRYLKDHPFRPRTIHASRCKLLGSGAGGMEPGVEEFSTSYLGLIRPDKDSTYCC